MVIFPFSPVVVPFFFLRGRTSISKSVCDCVSSAKSANWIVNFPLFRTENVLAIVL